MPRFAANISTMFTEWNFPDRIAAAADAGFSAVECQWPYDASAQAVSEQLSWHNLSMVLINAPAGNSGAGDVGLAAVPGRETECREGIHQALDYCLETGCSQVHLLSGCPPSNHSLEACLSALIENARYAADLYKQHDVRALIEPINTFDVPGYYLSHTKDAVALIDEVNRQNIGVQFDLYHAYRMGEDLEATILKYGDRFSHIQISGFPGRHEPDEGEIDYLPLFTMIDAMGYSGWIGCEYKPISTTLEGLGWAKPFGIGA